MTEERNNSVQSAAVGSQRSEWQQKKHSSYVPGQKCGKWSEEEHMKYVVFIDYNKQKMRSKEKRRSNKFYEEMSRFVSTRNALQCRSHHQKLEEKYNHINKIVNLYKTAFNKATYRQLMDQLDAATHQKKFDFSEKVKARQIVRIDAEIQTEIQDIRCQFIQVEPNIIVVQSKTHHLPHPHFYHPPSIYYPSPYPPYEHNGRTAISPPYPHHQFGWWGAASPKGF